MTYHPFEPAISYNMEAHDRPPCRICGRERVANPDHFKTEEANPVSDKDFTVTTETVHQTLNANAVEKEQNPVEQYAVYGCVAIEHHSEDRVDLLTFDLAVEIVKGLDWAKGGDTLQILRGVIADLEPKTRHWPTRSITFWENVGLQYSPADLNRDYTPETVEA